MFFTSLFDLLFFGVALIGVVVNSYNLFKQFAFDRNQVTQKITLCHGVDKSKQAEAFIKVKRLRQILNEGKTYGSYVTEKSRYTIASTFNTTSMEAILKYKHNQTRTQVTTVSEGNGSPIYNIAFLSDHGAYDLKRWFYQRFFEYNKEINRYNITNVPMPNILDYNTKRFEQLWLNYMREQNLSQYDLIIAHGTSAEALLRYMESEVLKRALLIDAPDIYTAGERHGRAFLYR